MVVLVSCGVPILIWSGYCADGGSAASTTVAGARLLAWVGEAIGERVHLNESREIEQSGEMKLLSIWLGIVRWPRNNIIWSGFLFAITARGYNGLVLTYWLSQFFDSLIFKLLLPLQISQFHI